MKELQEYIDTCIIDEYADVDLQGCLSLSVESLSSHEISNFVNELMKHDTTVKDLVLFHMQKLINERLTECEIKSRERNGLKLVTLSNGDKQIISRERYY